MLPIPTNNTERQGRSFIYRIAGVAGKMGKNCGTQAAWQGCRV
jgi:hypothetical protein